MKIGKKQCIKCKKDLQISLSNLRGGQLTKCCVKCLDACKSQGNKPSVNTEDKDQDARTVVVVEFVSTTR